MRPDLSEIQDIEGRLLSIGRVKHLYVACPAWILASLNGIKQVLRMPVGVLCRLLQSLLVGEVLDSLVRLAVDLDVFEASVRLRELVGMTRVTVHMSIRVWCTPVTKENHNLMNGFLELAQIVPKHACILQIGLRIPLLGVNKERKLGGIPEEEDGRIVEYPVPISVFGVEFERKSSRIPRAIWRTLLSTDRREACNALRLLADFAEHIGRALNIDLAKIFHKLSSYGARTISEIS